MCCCLLFIFCRFLLDDRCSRCVVCLFAVWCGLLLLVVCCRFFCLWCVVVMYFVVVHFPHVLRGSLFAVSCVLRPGACC